MKTLQEKLLDLKRVIALVRSSVRFGLFPFANYVPFATYRNMSLAVRIRSAIEYLGLTYLKLGQFLALRYDILPKEICDELNHLFESVPPMPFGQAKAIVESDLGAPIETLYMDFGTTPIAAASVAQVHIAHTTAGKRVAVKVQRAGLEPIFKADIRNMRRIAGVAEKLGLAGRLSARGMIAQFEQWTLREMDFRIEGRTAERVASESEDYVVIPAVVWELTTRRILTMDFIDGVSVTDARDLVDARDRTALIRTLPDFDLPVALHNLAFASFAQLFTYGFFHGDPHPGNIFFMPGNRVAFLDFGIFGELNQEEREGVAAQIECLALGDLEGSFRFYARQVAITDETDYTGFRRDCLEVLNRWYKALADPNSPVEERHLAKYTGEMIDVSRRNGLRYDLNYLLFWRALNNLNGTLWRVDPNFDLVQSLREFFDERRPSEVERVLAVIDDPIWQDSVARAASQLPRQAERILSKQPGGNQVKIVQSRSKLARHSWLSESRASGLAILAVALALILAAKVGWLLKAGAGSTFRRLCLFGERKAPMSALADAIRFRDPVRLARLLRRLGPVATKAGQYLSLRRDLLPRAYTDELLKLTDDVPAFPWSEAKEILTADLGSSPELIFSYIDRAPIAAGSLAQVHRARLPDGTEVAIKIKRPGIDESITVELKRLRRLAAIVERGRSDFAISPSELIDEVAEWLSREVDFTRELESARRLRRAVADSAIQRIPLVYPSLSSPRIVAYEYLRGIPVSSILARGRASGAEGDSLLDEIDRRAVAVNLVEACLSQIFRYQFFHADLHPGNLLILENSVVGFVDFGFCDALDSSVRTNQLSYLTAVYNDDSAAMFKALTEILIAGELADGEGFRRDFMNARRKMEGRVTGKDNADDQPAGEYMSSVLNAARRNGYRVPTSILSIYRALLTAEAVAAQLGLADGIREVGRRFFTEVQSREFYGQLFDRDRIQQLLVSLLNLKRDAPRQLNQILTDIADGTLSLKVEVSEDPRISRARKQRSRLEACGILSVGVAVLLTMPNPPVVLGIPLRGILAFVLAGLYVAVIYFWRQL